MTSVIIEFKAFCSKCKSMTVGKVAVTFPMKTLMKCSSCGADIVEFGLGAPVEKEYVEVMTEGLIPTLMKIIPDFNEELIKNWIYERFPHGIGLYE